MDHMDERSKLRLLLEACHRVIAQLEDFARTDYPSRSEFAAVHLTVCRGISGRGRTVLLSQIANSETMGKKNPAYRPATGKALETGLFLSLLFHRRLVRLAPRRARRRFHGTARRGRPA